MKKTAKKLIFELDARQILFVFIGVVIAGFMVYKIGVVVGSKATRQEMTAARLNEDPRRKIKAPSLLNAQKMPAPEKQAETIETVLDKAKAEDPGSPIEKTTQAGEKAEIKKKKATVKKEKKVASAEKKSTAKPVKADAPAVSEERYFVQVASFSNVADARKRGLELKRKGYSVVIVKADIPGKGIYHRVRLGPFNSLGKAKSFALKFEKKEKVSTFIPID